MKMIDFSKFYPSLDTQRLNSSIKDLNERFDVFAKNSGQAIALSRSLQEGLKSALTKSLQGGVSSRSAKESLDLAKLSKLTGLGAQEAQQVSQSLAIPTEEIRKIILTIKKLNYADVNPDEKFKSLKEKFKIEPDQINQIEAILKVNVVKKPQDIVGKQSQFQESQEKLQKTSRLRDLEAKLQIQALFQERQDLFEERQRVKALDFQQKQQVNEIRFQEVQLQEKQVFTRKTQAEESKFQEGITQRRESNQRAFSSASQRADQAIAVARSPIGEQNALREKFRRENLVEERTQQAITKLNLVNQNFSVDQILKLAQKVSGASLDTEEGAKQVQGAVRGIRDEQQRQQQAADQKARLEFEQKLQTERLQFEQRQRADAQTFKVQQRNEELEFKRLQRNEELTFKQQERVAEAAFEEERRLLRTTFLELEHQREREFRQELQTAEAQFRQSQRLLDTENAQNIGKALSEAKSELSLSRLPKVKDEPQSRAFGGVIRQGQPYLVGDAPGGQITPYTEVIVPGADSYVIAANKVRELLSSEPAKKSGNIWQAPDAQEIQVVHQAVTPNEIVVPGRNQTTTDEPLPQPNVQSEDRLTQKIVPRVNSYAIATEIDQLVTGIGAVSPGVKKTDVSEYSGQRRAPEPFAPEQGQIFTGQSVQLTSAKNTEEPQKATPFKESDWYAKYEQTIASMPESNTERLRYSKALETSTSREDFYIKLFGDAELLKRTERLQPNRSAESPTPKPEIENLSNARGVITLGASPSVMNLKNSPMPIVKLEQREVVSKLQSLVTISQDEMQRMESVLGMLMQISSRPKSEITNNNRYYQVSNSDNVLAGTTL